MPTYEYACSSCDTTHEVQQKMTDPTLTECPACGKPTLRKVFSGVGIHFKGSGFYRTDSRDAKSSKATATKEKSSGGDSSSGSSGSSGLLRVLGLLHVIVQQFGQLLRLLGLLGLLRLLRVLLQQFGQLVACGQRFDRRGTLA